MSLQIQNRAVLVRAPENFKVYRQQERPVTVADRFEAARQAVDTGAEIATGVSAAWMGGQMGFAAIGGAVLGATALVGGVAAAASLPALVVAGAAAVGGGILLGKACAPVGEEISKAAGGFGEKIGARLGSAKWGKTAAKSLIALGMASTAGLPAVVWKMGAGLIAAGAGWAAAKVKGSEEGLEITDQATRQLHFDSLKSEPRQAVMAADSSIVLAGSDEQTVIAFDGKNVSRAFRSTPDSTIEMKVVNGFLVGGPAD